MLKAIFLDMDETLCATSVADKQALATLKHYVQSQFPTLNADTFCQRYIAGVYKQLNDEFPQLVALLDNELLFRQTLVQTLFAQQQLTITFDQAVAIQASFDDGRMAGFDFFPHVKAMLACLRQQYKLVVITNGPVFSQHPKLAATAMAEHVDYIIVGGEEPEEKPALSIFQKALKLVGCQSSEVIHMGDSLAADIAGANGAGITSVWVDTGKVSDHQKLSLITPTYIVQQPQQLLDIIKQHIG
ncbi:Pyrimidine 5'-nucleotidase YjjG [Photobacterium malacitanum]|uniref:Pyrimidine 5'-nucleotidase YjjG n=1 Tax=Photobacterium malacitanum TaxID=2204294 RepID=A0A1Y6M8J1_9GAMM|nr:HAD family hydrolase [Photobacterium malacitanum]SMY32080.1 Pyrimidine 5'-nucleotidase YjjG [Photobacterium malacitanum]